MREKGSAVAEALASSISPHVWKPYPQCHADFKPCDPLCNLKRCARQRVCPIYSVLSLGGWRDSLCRAPSKSGKQCLVSPGSAESHRHPTDLHFVPPEAGPSPTPRTSCPRDAASVMQHAWLHAAAGKAKPFPREPTGFAAAKEAGCESIRTHDAPTEQNTNLCRNLVWPLTQKG